MHRRAPILPPAHVPRDDARAVRSPRAIARDALLAFGAAVKIEKLRDGDEDADGTDERDDERDDDGDAVSNQGDDVARVRVVR